jgi:hypothetical protein
MLSMTTALALALQAAPAPPVCAAGLATGSSPKIWVYKSPGARKTDKLRRGSPLFVCSANGGWVYVLYRDRSHACPGTAAGIDVRYASACAGGWVQRQQVTLIRR